jgi:hypothetical protein
MTAVAILPQESTQTPGCRYRAVAGTRRGEGPTPGTALDALTAQIDKAERPELILLQTMEEDAFFSDQQRERLTELMAAWRSSHDKEEGRTDPELEALVDAELAAAARRAESIFAAGS